MELKKEICRAFCDGVEVSFFRGGMAVSTPYYNSFGDKIGMYVLEQDNGQYRIIDNALTVAFLENQGVNLDNTSKNEAFNLLLKQYDVTYDEELGELFKDNLHEKVLPKSILDFSALLLRMDDLLFLTKERVENTFKEEVKNAILKELSGKVRIVENQPVYDTLAEVVPDMVFYPIDRVPVALFLANNESKLWQAIHLRMIANYEFNLDISVVAMLENDRTGNQNIRRKADNRLDAIPRYEGGKKDAIHRVITEVMGHQLVLAH